MLKIRQNNVYYIYTCINNCNIKTHTLPGIIPVLFDNVNYDDFVKFKFDGDLFNFFLKNSLLFSESFEKKDIQTIINLNLELYENLNFTKFDIFNNLFGDLNNNVNLYGINLNLICINNHHHNYNIETYLKNKYNDNTNSCIIYTKLDNLLSYIAKLINKFNLQTNPLLYIKYNDCIKGIDNEFIINYKNNDFFDDLINVSLKKYDINIICKLPIINFGNNSITNLYFIKYISTKYDNKSSSYITEKKKYFKYIKI